MSVDQLSAVPKSEQASAIATIVSAFTDDPVERWLFPDTDEYLTHFPEFVAAFGGQAFREETAWTLGEFSAVALWFAPGPNRTERGSSKSSARAFHRRSVQIGLRSWSRWTSTTLSTRTGICPGLASTAPCKGPASGA